MNLVSLKPCPFCGASPYVTEDWKRRRDGGPQAYVLQHDDGLNSATCILARLGVNLAYAETLDAIGYSWNKRAEDGMITKR